MNQPAAPLTLSIKIISGIIIAMTIAFYVFGILHQSPLLAVAVFLTLIVIYCYLSAPIAYQIENNQLKIISRMGSKTFGPITNISKIDEPNKKLTLRLWGNGGLFAATGIFWNKEYGVFRAYVTTSDKSKLLLIETTETKIIISPADRNKMINK